MSRVLPLSTADTGLPAARGRRKAGRPCEGREERSVPHRLPIRLSFPYTSEGVITA